MFAASLHSRLSRKIWPYLILLAFSLSSLLPSSAVAETRTVSQRPGAKYSTIQSAILASTHDDVVEVEPGIYRESLFFGGRRIRVASIDGPEQTIIDPSGLGSAAVFIVGEPRLSVLSGFTIRGGTGRNLEQPIEPQSRTEDERSELPGMEQAFALSSDQSVTFGGGVICESASPTLENLIFENNQANTGGAVFVLSGSPLISNCVFRNNLAGDGGALASKFGSFSIQESLFENNVAVKGGAIYGRDSGLDCHRSVFRQNRAADGGAIYMFDNPGRVAAAHHCEFFQNIASTGGAIYALFGNLDLRYSVVSQNGQRGFDAAEVHFRGSTGTVQRNVFSSKANTEHLRCENGSELSYYCNIFWPAQVPELCLEGADNISIDPKFCQPKKGDFRYQADSPCLASHSPTGCGAVGPNNRAECPTLQPQEVFRLRENRLDDRSRTGDRSGYSAEETLRLEEKEKSFEQFKRDKNESNKTESP